MAAKEDDVHGVLHELGLGEAVDAGAMIEAHNKIDLLAPEDRGRAQNIADRNGAGLLLSASSGEGCDGLLARIDARLAMSRKILDLTVDLSDGATIAWLYSHGEVLKRVDNDETSQLTVGLNPEDAARFAHRGTASLV